MPRPRDDVADDAPVDDARVVAHALRRAANHRHRGTDARARRRARVAGETTTTTTTTNTKSVVPARDDDDRGRARDRVPTDWTLKSNARFSSGASLAWMADARAEAASEGVCAHARGEKTRERGETGGVMSTLEEHQRVLVRASYSFAYPDLAMTEAHAAATRAAASGAEWMRKREAMWCDALVSLYGLLRTRRCHAFYVVYGGRTILFCAPGVGGAAGGFAVATNGDAAFRRALHDASVDFTSADEEAAAIDRAKVARAKPWRAEDEKETETEENELLDRLEGGDASRAAGAADVDAALAAMDKPGASRRRAADTLVCRGAIAVSGLLNVLVEAEGGDPGCSDSTARGDVPTLLAPVPFAHGCARPVKLWPRTNATATRREEKEPRFHSLTGPSSTATTIRATYAAETARDELIPPWTLERMCAAVAARHDEFTVACSPHLATRGLNVGVLAAKDMFGARDEDAMETETAECAYYDREETASVMSPPPSASVLRVEYSAGKYYIPS